MGAGLKFIHFGVLILTFCVGAILLGLSIAANVNDVLDLPLTWSNDFLALVFNLSVLGIVVSSILILFSIFGLVTFVKGCFGRFLRILYFICLSLVCIFLMVAGIMALILATQGVLFGIEALYRNAWTNTVALQPDNACQIQTKFSCEGFYTGDCSSTNTTASLRCPTCDTQNTDTNPDAVGCYSAVVDTFRGWYMPMGIVSIVLASLTILDMMILCFL